MDLVHPVFVVLGERDECVIFLLLTQKANCSTTIMPVVAVVQLCWSIKAHKKYNFQMDPI